VATEENLLFDFLDSKKSIATFIASSVAVSECD